MYKKQIIFLICFAILAFTAPAQAGFMTLVHGLPALPGILPTNNPVDIALDGECKFFYVSYGQNLLLEFEEEGRRSVIFYESIPDTPCRGTVLGALDFDLDEKR
jgi:hypothetical protein